MPSLPRESTTSRSGRTTGIYQENEELKKKLRALEQRHSTLQRSNLGVMQASWNSERESWHSDAIRLHDAHRVHEQRMDISLDEVNLLVLKEQERTRQAKLLVAQRDFQLLSLKVLNDDLEFEIADLKEELDLFRAQAQADIDALNSELAQPSARLTNQNQVLGISNHEQQEVQDELETLRDKCAKIQTMNDKDKKRLERLRLEYDQAVSERNDAKRERDELRWSIAQLKEQMDNWKSLGREGDTQAGVLRQQLVDKDQAYKELEETFRSQRDLLKKTRLRTSEWENYAQGLNDDKEAALRELDEYKRELASLKKKLRKAESLANAKDAGHRSPGSDEPLQRVSQSQGHKREPGSEAETKGSPVPTSGKKRKASPSPQESSGPPEKKPKGRNRSEQPASQEMSKKKGKQKAREGGTTSAVSQPEEDTPAEPPLKPSPPKKRKINLSHQPPPKFAFQTTGTTTFSLPSDLSPVKPSQGTGPQSSSTLGSVARTLGIWQKRQ